MTEPRCVTRSDRADAEPAEGEHEGQTHVDSSAIDRPAPSPIAVERRDPDPPVEVGTATHRLSGCRVLLVEDEAFAGFMIETMLRARGCGDVWLVGSVEDALAQLQRQCPDVAVLDINLDRQLVFPVAEQLHRQQVPLLFATAYPREWMPPRWQRAPLLQKPYDLDRLFDALLALLPG